MPKAILIWFLLLFILPAVGAQSGTSGSVIPKSYDQGNLAEIRGKRKAYLNVAPSLQRDRILAELAKSKSDLELVSRVSEADFIIAYAIQPESGGMKSTGPYEEQITYFGRMMVYLLKDNERPRVFWKYSKVYADSLQRTRPRFDHERVEVVAVKTFIRELRKSRQAGK